MKLGHKSKDGAHVWDQESLRALHAKGKSDAQIADLFGCPDALVTFGRKRESFWEVVAKEMQPVELQEEPIKAKAKTTKKETYS